MKPRQDLPVAAPCDFVADRPFTLIITAISRLLLVRDRLLGKIPNATTTHHQSQLSVQRVSIGDAPLDAILVSPATPPIQAALLICHGIGEMVEHWTPVQQMLAANGIASLVFDYSGYGRSPGRLTPSQCERDAITAFVYLHEVLPATPISLLGFSMGSGIAAAVLDRLPIHRLILCAAFTSFKAAAASAGWPSWLSTITPEIWLNQEALRQCQVPVLIIHGEKDRLFPVQMAFDLQSACASQIELIVVPKLAHDDPYYHPEPSYWKLVSDFLVEP